MITGARLASIVAGLILPLAVLPAARPTDESTGRGRRSPVTLRQNSRTIRQSPRKPVSSPPAGSFSVSGVNFTGTKTVTASEVRIEVLRTDEPGAYDEVEAGRLRSDARAFGATLRIGKTGPAAIKSLYLDGGHALDVDGVLCYSSDRPETAQITWESTFLTLEARLSAPDTVWVRVPKKPTSIRSADGTLVRWRYDPDGGLVALYLPSGAHKLRLAWPTRGK